MTVTNLIKRNPTNKIFIILFSFELIQLSRSMFLNNVFKVASLFYFTQFSLDVLTKQRASLDLRTVLQTSRDQVLYIPLFSQLR